MREATIHIPHGEFDGHGIGTFLSRCRDAGLRNLTELACDGEGCLLVVTLEAPLPVSVLSNLSELEWWETLSSGNGQVRYLFKVKIPDQSGYYGSEGEFAVSNNEIRVEETGINVSIVGTQSALTRSIEQYHNIGVDVVLERITNYNGPHTSLDALTDRQRDILETAFELGYFEVPREASAADVATEFDLDQSTVTEHLRRAERNLLSELLSTPRQSL